MVYSIDLSVDLSLFIYLIWRLKPPINYLYETSKSIWNNLWDSIYNSWTLHSVIRMDGDTNIRNVKMNSSMQQNRERYCKKYQSRTGSLVHVDMGLNLVAMGQWVELDRQNIFLQVEKKWRNWHHHGNVNPKMRYTSLKCKRYRSDLQLTRIVIEVFAQIYNVRKTFLQ